MTKYFDPTARPAYPARPARPGNSRRILHPALSGAALALVLAGCATPPGGGADAGPAPSPLIVHTSSSQGWRQEPPYQAAASRAEPPAPSSRTRGRSLPPPQEASGRAGTPGASPDASGPGTMLNFVDADLQGVVRALARFTGRNFVVDPRVKGQLTLVSEAPVDAATAYAMLLSALRMQGFAVVEVDGVSRVMPEADAKLQGSAVTIPGQAGAARGGELTTRVFTLRYENAASLVPVLRPMIAPNNPINAYPGNNTLIITDYADNLDRIAQVIAGIDTPDSVNTDVVPIEYGVALDVAALASQLLDARGVDPSQQVTIVADPRSNSILLRAGSAERLELARDLIMRIDTPATRAGNLHVVYLRNAQATRLAEVLRGALGGQGGQGSQSAQGDARGATASLGGLSGGLSGGGRSGGLSGGLSGALTNTASSTGAAGTRTPMALGAGGPASLGGSDGAAMQPVSFSAGGATIQADPTTNTLIISAPAPLYRSLREVIDQLDQRRAQVLVESLIVEVNAEEAAQLGIQWMAGGSDISGGGSAFFGGANLGGSGITATGPTTIDAMAQGLSLGMVKGTVNILGTEIINLGVLARALQTKTGANILSTPNLMTLDNEEASIIVGSTVPFITGQYTTSGDGASNPFQTITREDVGLTLRIRPQISEGGTVKLALYQEVSSIDKSAPAAANAQVTRKRALETNVLVDDGQIIVLGGLLEDTVSDTTRAVPLLSDIPLIGNLFRYDSRQRSKTNLMVFLRPHIVRNAQDGARVTLDRYNYMRAAQSRLPLRASWLASENGLAPLPDFERNPDTGLLDLREPSDAPLGMPLGTPSGDFGEDGQPGGGTSWPEPMVEP